MKAYRPKEVKDHFLSQEVFSIDWSNPQLGKTLLNADCDLQRYYQSDDYISHQNQKTGLLGSLYSWAQQYMFRQKLKTIRKHQPRINRLLDFGCGVGGFMDFLAKKGIQVSGVESNENAAKIARNKGLHVTAKLEESVQKNDCITLWHVLEHMKDPQEILKSLQPLLEEDGLLVLALPNPNAWDASYYKEYWAAWDVPRHLWHFTSNGIEEMAALSGFQQIASYPMPLDAFYVSLLSESYKKNGFKWFRALWNGACSTIYGFQSKEFSSQLYLFRKA